MISQSVLLRISNFSDRKCKETQNTHFMFNNSPLRKVVLFGRTRQATDDILVRVIWRMNFACWMAEAAGTQSGHVTVIAFPRQQ